MIFFNEINRIQSCADCKYIDNNHSSFLFCIIQAMRPWLVVIALIPLYHTFQLYHIPWTLAQKNYKFAMGEQKEKLKEVKKKFLRAGLPFFYTIEKDRCSYSLMSQQACNKYATVKGSRRVSDRTWLRFCFLLAFSPLMCAHYRQLMPHKPPGHAERLKGRPLLEI